jgi:hypothetical protein
MAGFWGEPGTEDTSGTGLARFFSQPDIGSEIGERLGLVAEILSGVGSGRGLAGISEAMGEVNQRSAQRREYRKMTTMANRMADKLEPTNPDLAALIRANPRYGMELAGKIQFLPFETAETMKINEAKAKDEYQKALDLQAAKDNAEREKMRLTLRAMGINPDTMLASTGGATSCHGACGSGTDDSRPGAGRDSDHTVGRAWGRPVTGPASS